MAHWSTPAELASQVEGNAYLPTRLESCEKVLTPDLSSYSVRFSEITLFTRRQIGGLANFLAFQPQNRAGKVAARQMERDYRMRHLQRWLASWLRNPPGADSSVQGAQPHAAAFSTPRAAAWASRGMAGPGLQAASNRTAAAAQRAMRAVAAAQGGPLVVQPARGGGAAAQLFELMSSVAFPGPFQPYSSPHVLIAVCSEFEQIWTPCGYTRGELIGSLSLAPGERLTIEVHSWDKSTTRSETELASESEIRTSEKYTQRDALTVLQELASRENTKVDVGLKIPIPQFPLQMGLESTVEAQSRVNRTTEHIREATVEAANVLKVNRKMRIESSREVGRESKQTRVLENTNRCHTLNCHYFEIVANYLVTTRFRGVQPCLLVPYARTRFTIPVILCNEGVLRRSLLDRTFLSGFDAAHVLAVIRAQQEVEERRRLRRLELTGAQLAPFADQISDAYGVLESAVAALDAAIDVEGLGHQWEVAARLTDTQIDQIWAWHGLPVLVRAAFERFRQDLGGGAVASEAIRSLVAKLEPGIPPRRTYDAFVELNERLGTWSHYEEGDGQITGPTPWRLVGKEIADCDDGGVRDAVFSAKNALLALPAVDFDEFSEVPAAEEAVAVSDFDRLVCHLERNWLHYNQAIWAAESFEQRYERFFQQEWVVSLVENRIIGFYGNRVAFPLRDSAAVFAVDLDDLMAKIRDAAQDSEPVLISQPTPGQVLEAVVGECNACENYVRESRTIDLSLSRARARLAEAEADRVAGRVQAGDLTDPSPTPPTIAVELIGDGAGGGP